MRRCDIWARSSRSPKKTKTAGEQLLLVRYAHRRRSEIDSGRQKNVLAEVRGKLMRSVQPFWRGGGTAIALAKVGRGLQQLHAATFAA